MPTTSSSNSQTYLTIAQFCEQSGLSASTVRRRIQDGSLPVIQFGGKGKKLLIPGTAISLAVGTGDKHSSLITGTTNARVAASDPDTTTITEVSARPGPLPRWQRKFSESHLKRNN